jgi:hypothetical protein
MLTKTMLEYTAKGMLCFIVFIFSLNHIKAQNCTVNAGINTTICSGQRLELKGNAAGNISANTIQWTIVSQPSGASNTIAYPGSLLSEAGIATVTGTYTFRLAATCGDAIIPTDDVIITVLDAPVVPAITGTSSFSCYSGAPVSVTGTAPTAGQTVRWSVVTAGTGTFANATTNVTTFTPVFDADECNNSSRVSIRYTISNGNGCEQSVIRDYTFTRAYPVSATALPMFVCGPVTTLKGSCPGNGATVLWTLVNKPAGAPDPTINQPTARVSTVQNLQAGSYTFRYTVTGGCNPGPAEVTINVAGTAVVTQANAGKDQHFCTIPNSISLTGNNGAVGETVSWSQIEGASVMIASPATANTLVTGLTDAGGPYRFRYVISNGGCSTVDTVSIYKLPVLGITGPTVINICNSIVSSSISWGDIQFGNYKYGELDTAWVTISYLSGPAGNATVGLGRNIGGNSDPVPNSNKILSQGQSHAIKVSGSDLYLSFLGGNPNSYLYSLGFRFNFPLVFGVYKFRMNVTTACGTYEHELLVNRGAQGVSLNAGTDQLLACGTTSAFLAGNVTTGGLWQTVQKPAGAVDPINSSNNTAISPSLSVLTGGTYLFRYTNNNGPACTQTNTDDVRVVVASTPPSVPNAGADRTTCAGQAQLQGSAIPADALATWTLVSPADPAITFNNANIANPIVNNLQPNTAYTFRYTLENGCGSNADEVTITTTNNTTPTTPVITGSDCSSTTFSAATFSSNLVITHPAFTSGGGIDSVWKIVSIPAGITYTVTPVTTTTTRINFTITQSSYVGFIYGLRNTTCPGEVLYDTITRYYMKSTDTRVLDAGANQQLCAVNSFPTDITLSGSNTPGALWSQAYSSGTQPSVIASPNSNTTTVTLPGSGIYRYEYRVQNDLVDRCTSAGIPKVDFVQVTVSSPGSTALAGDDINFCNATGVTNLNATPLTVGTGRWEVYSVVAGNAPVIETPGSATSAITFSRSGTVILKWSSYGTVDECGPSSADLVTVTYVAPARAGNDQALCNSSSANLNAQDVSPATGTWSQVGGVAASINDANSAQTIVSGLTAGTYTFRWTVSGGAGCVSTDDVVITVSSNVLTANAGVNQNSCAGGNNTIALDAVAAPAGFTGSWSLAGKPAAAPVGSFSQISSPQSWYNGITVSGKYTFAWTITNGTCSSTDYVDAFAGTVPCTLPVVLKNFTADINRTTCAVTLNWESHTEENAAAYLIERSVDGINYQAIQELAAKGNSNTVQRYAWEDNSVAGVMYYYRLKMVDNDASFTYSGVIKVNLPCFSGLQMQVTPSPITRKQPVQVSIQATASVNRGTLEVRNMAGQLLYSYPVVLTSGNNRITLPYTVANAGTYIIELKDKGRSLLTTKFIVQ